MTDAPLLAGIHHLKLPVRDLARTREWYAGFDYFAIGVPDRRALEALAARLDGLGESHAGIHEASIGWILPHVYDPDGYDLRFYTHTRE